MGLDMDWHSGLPFSAWLLSGSEAELEVVSSEVLQCH